MITPSQQLFTIDDLAGLLRVDFGSRGIAATVEVSEWAEEMHRGAPRVVLGLGRFTLGEPDGHYQPGAWFPAGAGSVARPILDDAQRVKVWVHHPGSGTGEAVAERARRATDQLLRHTARAIRRALAGPMRSVAEGEWDERQAAGVSAYPAFTYGSLARFEVVLASPVLDDPFAVGEGGEIEVASGVAYPDGSSTPAETINQEAP